MKGHGSEDPPLRQRLVEFEVGVMGVALLAGDSVLAGRPEFGRVADFVEHAVVVCGGIDTEIAFAVRVEQANRGFFFVEPGEHGGAEIPGIGIRELNKFGHRLRDDAIASGRGRVWPTGTDDFIVAASGKNF